MAEHFGFTKLIVGDLEASARFYKSVCGLTEQARVRSKVGGRPMNEILFNPAVPGGTTFVLLAFDDEPKPAISELILGFITTDIVAFVDRVGAAGGTIVDELATRPEFGVKVAIVKDPEGHLIEIVQTI